MTEPINTLVSHLIVFKPSRLGSDIYGCAEAAIAVAQNNTCPIVLIFNNVSLYIDHTRTVQSIVSEYDARTTNVWNVKRALYCKE